MMERWWLNSNMTTVNGTNSFVEDRWPRKLCQSIRHSVQVNRPRKSNGSTEIVPNEVCYLVYDPVNSGFDHIKNSRQHTERKPIGKPIDIDQLFYFVAPAMVLFSLEGRVCMARLLHLKSCLISNSTLNHRRKMGTYCSYSTHSR